MANEKHQPPPLMAIKEFSVVTRVQQNVPYRCRRDRTLLAAPALPAKLVEEAEPEDLVSLRDEHPGGAQQQRHHRRRHPRDHDAPPDTTSRAADNCQEEAAVPRHFFETFNVNQASEYKIQSACSICAFQLAE